MGVSMHGAASAMFGVQSCMREGFSDWLGDNE